MSNTTDSSKGNSQHQMFTKTNNYDSLDLAILNDIITAMHDPELVRSVEQQIDDTEAKTMKNTNTVFRCWKESFSFTPWEYHCNPELTMKRVSAAKHDIHRHHEDQQTTAGTSTTTEVLAKAGTTTADDDDDDHVVVYYPSWTYMDLRVIQNHKFAQDQFIQGIQHARDKQYAKAESCYKGVLNLVPFHTDCLVAYGALCASNSSNENIDEQWIKAEQMLKHAIDLDTQCPNAQFYLDKIAVEKQKRLEQKKYHNHHRSYLDQHQQFNSSSTSSNVLIVPQKALNDAIVERIILCGPDDGASDVYYDEAGGEGKRREKKKHRRRRDKKEKKKHRQRRRQHYNDSSSSSFDHDDESSSSSSSSSHRRRSQHRRRKSKEIKSQNTHNRSSSKKKSRRKRSLTTDENNVRSTVLSQAINNGDLVSIA